jgi:hypothetical protein
MRLKVKSGYNLKIILNQLYNITTLNRDNSLSTNGFEDQEYIRLLSQIIDFPKSKSHVDIENLVTLAFKNCLISKEVTEVNFLTEINNEFKKKVAKKEEVFYVLTSINLNIEPTFIKKLTLLECEIDFITDGFKNKFTGREGVIKKVDKSLAIDATPFGYLRVEIKVKSRSEYEAIQRGINALNLFRALSCIEMNPVSLIVGDLYQSINKIVLGKVHTIHDIDGTTFDHPILYEPKFRKLKVEKPKNEDVFQKNIKFFVDRINSSQFSNDIELALLRYVDALDELDNNVAVTKLWGALESIVVQDKNNCELIPSRLAALYSDFQLKKQFIMHIKEYRNSFIHTGVGDDDSIHRAYYLQRLMIKSLFFYINPTFSFSSLNEANQLLDKIALGEEKLTSEMELTKKALSFFKLNDNN